MLKHHLQHLTKTVLHDLEVTAANVLNAYMIAPNWRVLGQGFEKDAGKSASIARALHCLKSADASFRTHLAQCMWELGYKS